MPTLESTTTDGQVYSSLRPDIAGITNSGNYDLVEVVSPSSQTYVDMSSKIDQMIQLFANAGLRANGWVIP